jgi:GH43 family beta-xylosidase
MNSKINGKITEYNKPFIIQRADPHIYRHSDGTYYFTASVPEYDRIILRRSDTIQGLKDADEKIIWQKYNTGIMSKHIWAPEIHFLDGEWYIHFAAGDIDDVWEIRPYALKCTGSNPMYDDWVECGKLEAVPGDETSFTGFSLDATVFEHKGVNYLVWAEKPRDIEPPISNLYIAPLDGPLKLASMPKLLTTPEKDWETVDFAVNEGPAIIKKDGLIYLTFSASATGKCYCMGLMYISEKSDIMDMSAWKKLDQPVFVTDVEKGIYGPGHNSFTKTADGRDICVFHARTYGEITGDPLYDPNRHTMLLEVKWENNLPVFNACPASEQAGF